MTKILIAAAGTGGHVFPALAVAEGMRECGLQVAWLGTTHGIENRLVPPTGIRLHRIVMRGLRGKGKLDLLLAPLKLIRATLATGLAFLKERPDVVLVMGGYISGPAALWAKAFRARLITHEQNAVCGTANRLVSKLSHLNLSAYPKVFPSGVLQRQVGNPVRSSLLALGQELHAEPVRKAEGSPRVLILGGSLGAKPINDLVISMWRLPELQGKGVEVWHQTGERDEERVRRAYEALDWFHAKVEAFIDDMEAAWRWADVVICRAGAMTVSEVMVVGCPAIFIPLPQAIDDHQRKNADYVVEQGGGLLCPQRSTKPEALWHALLGLIEDAAKRQAMRTTLNKLASWQACEAIIDACVPPAEEA